MTRRQLKSLLKEKNVLPQSLVQHRDSGHFVADFFAPDMSTPVDTAYTYAQRIKNALPQARIVTTYDSIADWRVDQPVINALVIFEVSHA